MGRSQIGQIPDEISEKTLSGRRGGWSESASGTAMFLHFAL